MHNNKHITMKKITFILIALAVAATTKAQTTTVTDTVAYLKSIETQKSLFVGKPFSVLLDSLKIDIKAFAGTPNPTNISKEKATSFYFVNPKYLEDFSEKYLRIEWATELDGTRSDEIFDTPTVSGTWIAEARDFYKTAIIKDIKAK